MTDTTTVPLDTPIQRGSTTLDSIQVRRPKSGELRGVALAPLLQLDVLSLRTLLPRITIPTLTAPEIDNLDPADLMALGSEVVNFLLPKADRLPASPTA